MDALREGVAFLQAQWLHTLLVTGPDAPTFLNGLLTQDIARMAVGAARPSALADRLGHFEGDLWIARDADQFQLCLPADRLSFLVERLDRHRFSERVTWIVPEARNERWLLLGPKAGVAMATLERAAVPAVRDFEPLPALGQGALRIRIRETAANEFLIEAPAAENDRVRVELDRAGAQPVSSTAMHLRRYESGVGAYGFEAGAERLVPEVGLLDRLHYDKGCFLGQETLARLHFRGGLNWRLNRFRLHRAPAIGSALLVRGERVGWIAGCIRADDAGVRGLGFLHRRFHEEPGTLTTIDGIDAEPLGLVRPPASNPETA